jgi:hypothetical protein
MAGKLSEVISNQGFKNRKYLQVIVAVEDGFSCAYVRDEEMFKDVEALEIGSNISITGAIPPTRTPSTKPVFLEASFIVKT